MILSYLTHKKWLLNNNGLKIIATQSSIAYKDLVRSMQCRSEVLTCMTNNYETLEIAKTFDFVGDPLLSGDITKKYMATIEKNYLESLDESTRYKIISAFRNLEVVLQDSLLLEDLSLEINADEDLKKLFKASELHLNQVVLQKPYDIIETVLKIHQNCNLKTIPVFCNVAHYLDDEELAELAKIAKQMNMMLLFIEFTSADLVVVSTDVQFYYIDKDLVDWY